MIDILYHLADTLIAGSVGPYGACLNDGSEFSGSYTENLSIQVYKIILYLHRKPLIVYPGVLKRTCVLKTNIMKL